MKRKDVYFSSRKFLITIYAITAIVLLCAAGRITSADCVYGIGAALLFYNGSNVVEKHVDKKNNGNILDPIPEGENDKTKNIN